MPNIHNGVEKAPSHDRLFNQTVRILVLPFHPSISTSLTFTAHCPFQTLAVHTHRYFNWSRSFQLDNNEAHFEASSTPEAHISYIAVAPVANITKQPLFHTVTGISPVASEAIVFHSISTVLPLSMNGALSVKKLSVSGLNVPTNVKWRSVCVGLIAS